MDTKNHPVWDVYDQMRTTRLNVKYLRNNIRMNNGWNTAMTVILALSTASLASIFWFLSTESLSVTIKSLSSLSGIVAVLKPILNLTSKIQKDEKLLSAYRILEYDLEQIKIGVSQSGSYTEILKNKFIEAMDRKKGIISSEDNNSEPSRKKIKKLFAEVELELPIDSFFIPA